MQTLVHALRDGLQKQDAGTRVISVHCADDPEFETAFQPKDEGEGTQIATRMDITFSVEVVVVDSGWLSMASASRF